MLKNYIKIAFKVMLRQKFFTTVSLFGISFTIMIFSIATGMFGMVFGNNAPAVNKDRLLYFKSIGVEGDSSKFTQATGDSALFGSIGLLGDVEKITMYSKGVINSFGQGEVSFLNIAFIDDKFWQIYRFKFVEGHAFTLKDIREGQTYAVITASAKKHFFGDGDALGKSIGTKYNLKVIGVVEDPESLMGPFPESASIWAPLSLYKAKNRSAVILAGNSSAVEPLKDAIANDFARRSNVSPDRVYMNAGSIYDLMQFTELLTMLGGFLLFTMLIPALNLVGININRIAERSSEIGIRKAFGASSGALTRQFIIENMIITLAGGLIGIAGTLLVSDTIIKQLYYNHPEAVVASHNFLLSWKAIGCAMAGTLFFGLLSGIVPAWRMSRLHVVNALKGGRS